MKKKLLARVGVLLALLLCLTGCGQPKRYPAPRIEADAAAVLTLYAFNGEAERVFGLMNLGHAFVSVKNLSARPLTLAGYTLEPDSEVSIGTWGMDAHWGIWYNAESVYLTLGRYKGRVSLTQGLSAQDIDTLTAYLRANDTWTFFRNCSYFALDLWNLTAAPDERIDLGGLITPSKVHKRLSATDGSQVERPIPVFGRTGYAPDGTPASFTEFALRDKA